MLTNTHNKHIGGLSDGNMNYIYRVPINRSENGNTVEMNYEQAQFGHESTRYAATLQFLESRGWHSPRTSGRIITNPFNTNKLIRVER